MDYHALDTFNDTTIDIQPDNKVSSLRPVSPIPIRPKEESLGLSRAASLAHPAFLASAASTFYRQYSTLALHPCPVTFFCDSYLHFWSSALPVRISSDSLQSKQSYSRTSVEDSQANSELMVRVVAAAAPDSVDCLLVCRLSLVAYG